MVNPKVIQDSVLQGFMSQGVLFPRSTCSARSAVVLLISWQLPACFGLLCLDFWSTPAQPTPESSARSSPCTNLQSAWCGMFCTRQQGMTAVLVTTLQVQLHQRSGAVDAGGGRLCDGSVCMQLVCRHYTMMISCAEVQSLSTLKAHHIAWLAQSLQASCASSLVIVLVLRCSDCLR